MKNDKWTQCDKNRRRLHFFRQKRTRNNDERRGEKIRHDVVLLYPGKTARRHMQGSLSLRATVYRLRHRSGRHSDEQATARTVAEKPATVAKWSVHRRRDYTQSKGDELLPSLRCSFFVRPANAGSSVGITKERAANALERAVAEAEKPTDNPL